MHSRIVISLNVLFATVQYTLFCKCHRVDIRLNVGRMMQPCLKMASSIWWDFRMLSKFTKREGVSFYMHLFVINNSAVTDQSKESARDG